MIERAGANRGTLWFFSALMFCVGMQMAETGAALDRMTRTLGLDPAEQGTLVSARFVGGVVVGVLLWAGHSRVRFRGALLGALLLLPVSGLLLLFPSYPAALLVATLRGLTVGAIIPLSGMFASAQKRWPPALVASAVNAAVSAGLVLLSLVALVLSTDPSIPWQAYWAVSSGLGLVLLCLLPRVSFPAESKPDAGGPEISRRATDWRLAVAGLLLVGSESVLLGLIPAQSAAISPFSFGGELYALVLMTGILLGRTGSAFFFGLFPTLRVIGGSIAVVVAGGFLWSLAPSLAPLSVFLSGAGTAALFPGLVAVASERNPNKAGATIAAIGWTGGIGGTVVPGAAGLLLSAGVPARLTSAFVVSAALGAYVLVRLRSPGGSETQPPGP